MAEIAAFTNISPEIKNKFWRVNIHLKEEVSMLGLGIIEKINGGIDLLFQMRGSGADVLSEDRKVLLGDDSSGHPDFQNAVEAEIKHYDKYFLSDESDGWLATSIKGLVGLCRENGIPVYNKKEALSRQINEFPATLIASGDRYGKTVAANGMTEKFKIYLTDERSQMVEEIFKLEGNNGLGQVLNSLKPTAQGLI